MKQRHAIALASGVRPGDRVSADVSVRKRQLRPGDAPRRTYAGEACLHELVAAQAARTPNRIAVSCAGAVLTYGELLDRARSLAGHLQALGVGPETRVGICAERSVELVVAVLGTLTAGAAYVPLDPSYPAERLAYMLEDSGAAVLLAQERLTAVLPPHRARVVLLDGGAEPGAFGAPFVPVPSLPDALAYVMYTSGSTGRPKGVMNSHRAVRNRLLWQREDLGLHADDRVLQKTPFSFDISVWELLATLIAGARLVMARPGGQGDPAYLVETIEREGITVVHFVASMMRAFLSAPGLERLSSLRCVVNGGEALPPEVERQFFARFGIAGPGLYNLYGPTEAAIEATWWPCEPGGPSATVPIGRPIGNVSIRILSADLQPVANGEAGELHIGGVAPARGYLGRPDLTAEKFIPDPFARRRGGRLYKTGDLARFRPDGVIEYLGRIDHQVKIRGFRIELGEIEAALAEHPAVRASVVTARERNGEARLVAYVVSAAGGDDASGLLRSHLAARLPDYMMPADFVFLETLPLTPSGKLDRKALPEPRQAEREHVAPETPLERFLAGLWRQALGVERAGRRDSFFALGGTSISAAVVTNRLQRELGEIVHPVVLFDAPTVAELAAYLGREHGQAVARIWGAESLAGGPAVLATADRRIGELEIAELHRLIEPLAPAAAEPKNPPAVFILAPPRSGTTLLRVMLGGHPGLFAPPELELLSFNTLAERRAAFPGRDAFWLQGLLRAVMELRGRSLEEAQALVAGWERQGWTTQRAYGQLQEWTGRRKLVDKTTSYALDPAVLRRAEEAFENPFYIHLVRHPCGMIRSFEEARIEQVFFRRPHSFSRRELAELLWVVSQRNIAAHLAAIPSERQHQVRFEDLVRNPEGELRRLCSALGLDYHPDMADPYKDERARMTDGVHAGGGMLGDMKFHQHRGVEAGAADRWQQAYGDDFLGAPTWETAAVFAYERPQRPRPNLLQPAPNRSGEPMPLSPAQERLWFLDRLAPGSAAYNIAREIRLHGRLDACALGSALEEIVRRHEVLRTVFADRDGAPVQVVQPAAGAPLPLIDLAALPAPARAAEERRLAEAARRPFDLARDPMLRGALLRFGSGEHALLLVLHHIAADGWSMGVLAGELEALYRQGAAGGPPLAPQPLQYADYVAWQRWWLAGEEPAAKLAAWRQRLADLPEGLELPADRPRPAAQSFRGGVERMVLPPAVAGGVEALARRSGATVFMALLAGFETLLHRLTGQEDLTVGVPAANRNRPELEGLIGFFVNSLVLRADFAADPTFAAALGRVREAALFAYAHQDLPFERLVAELAPERSLDHAPLFQVMFSLQEAPVTALDLGTDLRGEMLEIDTGTAKFDLWLQALRHAGGLAVKAEYATDLFAPATVARLLRCFRVLLEGALAAPGVRVSELPLLDGAEREQVLAKWNRTAAEIPDVPVHAQVARWARETPQALAVAWEGGELTYGELNRRANRLARRLRRMGIGPDEVVALRLQRSPELVVAALAALKAGGAYLPIDPAYPAERLAFTLRNSAASVLVTVERLVLADLPVEVLALDVLDLTEESDEDLDPAGCGADQLAYLIYTSGSTGEPKGIELRHRGLANLAAWTHRAMGHAAADRCTLIAGPGFDVSIWEVWSALTAGASLHVPPAEVVASPADLLAWLARQGLTVGFLPTPLMEALLAEPMPAGLRLRSVFTGGDRLTRRPPPDLPFAVLNGYGPAESTVLTSTGWVAPAGERPPEIGSPLANTRVYILDRGLRPVPVGVPGELCVGGVGLARGYRRRPELTAERFLPDSFGEPGARLYRTGDLARWLPHGEIEFLGRMDFQVKIRCFRIELGEIQAVLGRHPAVREAAVLVREEGSGLCAYAVLRGEEKPVTAEILRGFLARSLPEYMIPTAWVFLDALPLTPNGKLDRRSLARLAPAVEPEAAVAPRSPLEELLAGLFAQVLGLERPVGAHEDFFHLGGHSLLATQLVSRVREACGADLGVRGVFEAPTVARLAERIAAAAPHPEMPPLVPAPREGGLPLSFAQQRLWFLDSVRPGTAIYNLTQAYELRGGLAAAVLGAALAEVVRRHEALRTRFVTTPETGGPRQVVAPPAERPQPLPVVDLAGLPEPARSAEAERLADAESRRPYDLQRGPLLRASLLRLGGDEHRLLLGMHHIISDGWSVGVLVEEVSALYRALAAGEPSPLPPLPVQYPDFAAWQRRCLQGVALEKQLAWWRERLAGAPAVLELPGDRPRPAVASLAGGVARLALGAGLTADIGALSRRSGATPFMTFLAAFQALLHRYSGQEDLVVGSPVAGRGRLELERLIGLFVNMLSLRADLSGDPSFHRLLAAVRETALGAYTHQDLPFDRLVEELSPDRDAARTPVFQVVVALQEANPRPDLGPGIATAAAALPSGTAKFDLAVFLERGPDGVTAVAEHAADLFDGATVRRLLGHFRVLLAGIVADPGVALSALPLLAPDEHQQVVTDWNRTAAEIPDAPAHVRFAERARRTPQALAVAAGSRTLTYGELDAQARRLAAGLRRRGVGAEEVVALLLERSPELVTAALAVLQAGGAYLPIDPAYPKDRVLHMLRDSGARALVTTGERWAELEDVHAGPPFQVIRLDLEEGLEEAGLERLAAPEPEALAYVIYTSGSTGLPKGTELRHRGLSNLCAWHLRTHGLGPQDRTSLLAGPGFDASVWEMWPPLVAGASLHVPPAEVARDPSALLPWLAEQGITVAFLPTPLAEAALTEPVPERLALRALLTGGDRLRRRPAAGMPFALVNHYGPTESTVVATAGVVAPEGDRLPDIGGAIANTRVYVLGRALQPLPAGVAGELCVAGEGLARGYRGRPETTAERFLPDPFGPPGRRLYRTGDLVRRLPGGGLDFLGRIDHQVKIRGFRIELGEIEAALQDLPGVAAAAVLAREDHAGERRLAAYVVAPAATAEELREALLRRLPEPMVPAAWVFLDEMPLTANGKLDRRALAAIAPPEPDGAAADDARNPIEEIVGDLFVEVLGLERTLGIEEDFFRLGGHSLLVVHLASRLRAAFGVDLELTAIFDRPTVAGVAALVAAEARADRPAAPPVVPLRRGEAPLSFAQQRLWFLDRYEAGTALYNITVAFDIRGAGLRPAALAGALDEVVRRHEALRSVFHEAADGEPVQAVLPFAPRALPIVDLGGLGRAGEAADRIARGAAAQPFDLGHGPLLRGLLLRLGATEHRLVLALHHIVSDGWSVGLLVREISQLCRALASGRPSPLPPLPVQYADFAVWQRRWLAGETLAAEVAWWRQRLDGMPTALELPADRPRPAVQSSRGAFRRTAIDPAVAAGLAALGRRQGATFFMTAAAAFYALLHRWTGGEDLIVGTPVAGRGRAEVEGLIGFFVNTLVLRASLAGDPQFQELLARVRTEALAAYAHQDVPFEQLVAELAPGRDLSRTPLFQVLIALQEAPVSELDLGPGFTAPMSEVWTDTAKFELALHFARRGDGLTAGFEYSTDLFAAATIDRFLAHLQTLLAGIAAAPEARISELPLLPDSELRQILSFDAAGPVHPSGELLHGLFAAQAARTPAALAVVCGGEALTYGELAARSGRLAQRLRRLGVGPEVAVGICLERQAGLVVALLAVLRAGGFYVPLDPVYPAERLAYLLADSGCRLVLTEAAVEAALPPSKAQRVRLDEVERDARDSRDNRDKTEVLPGNLAYLIYTSGSTGRPKAVAIEHRSAVVLAHWARRVFSPEDFAGMLGSTSITFDMSVFEIFVTLAWGGTLILVENALALPALKAPGALPAGVEVRLLDTVPSAAAELLRTDGLPASVRTINLGGEAVPRSLADLAYRRPETERLYNLYGPSEDTTFSTIALIERQAERAPAIGRPLDGTHGWVLDRNLRLAPVGVPGELYLAGAGLARGYLGRPELTAERFLPDPFGAPGARMYKTSDLVRRRPDGELEYLGRLDHQVKIRGFRVELGEVEAALAACAGVRNAVVVAREDQAGVRGLVAYVAGEAAPEALRQALQGKLPAYMTPSAFVLLDDLPRLPNGKVDRRSLPAPAWSRADDEPRALPRTAIEKKLADLWAHVLGAGGLGIHDSFFDLGGHSLLAMRIVSRVRDLFGVELPVRVLFERPTIAGTAAVIAGLIRERAGTAPPEAIALQGLSSAPLSYMQQRLWFLDRLQPGLAVYNLPVLLRLAGPLAAGALAAALAEILRRHAALRTTFALAGENAEPVQVVNDFSHALARAAALAQVDLSALPAARRQEAAEQLVGLEQRRAFDLERGPLFRSLLARLGPEDHRLVLTMHHIVSDGWSVGVLLEELRILYGAFSAGRPSPLPELPLQYTDYAVWQRRWLAEGEMAAQLDWWRQRLAGPPPALELPADRPRRTVPSLRGALEKRVLEPQLAAAVERLGHRRGTTLFMTLLAAFDLQLHRYTGEDDLWVGTPVSNRSRAEFESLIGFFVNTLVLRTDLGGEPTFAVLLDRVRETVLAANANPDVPFERLVEELAPAREMSRSPLFDVTFSSQDEWTSQAELAPGLTLFRLQADTGSSKFDLSLGVWKASDGSVAVGAEYSSDLFEPVTAQRMLGHFLVLLAAAVADPEVCIEDLPLLTAEERGQLRADWSGGEGLPVSSPTLHGLFARQARRTPGAPAVDGGAQRLTYRELDVRAAGVARRLEAWGVRPETRVALFAGRSPELAVGFLGILQAGGACVPLDPAQPAERLAFLLADSRAAAVVTTADLAPSLPPAGLPLLLLGEEEKDAEDRQGERDAVLPGQLAYVIYTSGSTGRPKGVAVAHGEAAAHCETAARAYGLGPRDRVLLVSSPGFDVVIEEIFCTLAAGATLVVAGTDAWVPGDLSRKAEELALTVISPSTAVWQQWVREIAAGTPPPSLRLVIVGGEELPAAPVRRWLRTPFAAVRLLNGYGPTEAVVTATVHEAALANLGTGASAPIGRPFAGRSALVLDRRLRPVPAGVPGELCLGGILARGYLEQPALTAERFIPDPYGAPGARLYRSGDLVRLGPGGALEFLGRIDRQVKVRGFRIEPGEIEALLASHPAIAAAAVLAPEVEGERRLTAYLEPRQEAPAGAELRDFLAQRLPAYMIPAAFVILDHLPLTAGGKIDRRALPAAGAQREVASEIVAPRTPCEEQLAHIWSTVLGVAAVGVHDNFWQLGGHSLLATRVTSRVREVFGVELPLRAFFEQPTVASLAERIEESRREHGVGGEPGSIAKEAGRTAPLSYPQQRLWFLDRLQPGLAVYNLPVALAVAGTLQADVLAAVLSEIVRRHTVLRTTFAVDESGEPLQVVGEAFAVALPQVDLSGLPEPWRDTEGERLLAAEARRAFDLGGSVLRSLLVRLAPADHRLLLTLHHIAADGWSLGVLSRELQTLYRAFVAGEPSPLAELPIQYADFAVWQRRWLASGELEAQLDWWRRHLAGGPPAFELPADHPRPAVQSLRGGTERVMLEPELAAAVERLTALRGMTPFMTLFTAFAIVLHRSTGTDDLWIGTAVAHRARGETEDLIGFFVNTLVLRTDLTGNPTFDELLGRVREMALAAFAHQDVPFETLVEELAPQRDLSRNPLLQVLFTVDSEKAVRRELAPGVALEPLEVDTGTAKFDFSLGFRKTAEGRLMAEAEYALDLFEPATARRLLERLTGLLAGAVARPATAAADLPLLTAGERRQVLVDWNPGPTRYPREATLHELFAAKAAQTPDAVAVVAAGGEVTYAELDRRAGLLAARLRALGVGPDVGVGVCAERSADLIAAILGILKAGGAYVPLDPQYPRERLAGMLADAGVRVQVVEDRFATALPAAGARVLLSAAFQEGIRPPAGAAVDPENLAYVMFTSGSTGRPKGVAVTHRNVVRLVRETNYARFGREEVFLQLAPVSFDAATLEIWGPLLHGGRLVMPPPGPLSLEQLGASLERYGVTSLFLTTGLFNQMVESRLETFRGVRQLMTGGDVGSPAHLHQAARTLPRTVVIHCYGPTEGTTFTTCYPLTPETGTPVPIGRPIANTRVYVLDAGQRLVPPGVPGKLYVAGDGLARGYVGRPGLTAERFVPDPVSGEPGARLYDTGDLVRWRHGELEFLGRVDSQVKVRGFRIEPGEIEAVLESHPDVQAAAVIPREDTPGDKRLVAYVVAGAEGVTPAGLRQMLQERLPQFMVPAAVVLLEALPLTAAGKLDRRALPAPELSRQPAAELVLPRTPLEEEVADLWRAVLGIERIGVHDSFWDLGGHSLLATKILSRVRQVFGIDLPLSSLFLNPQLGEFADAVGRGVLAAEGGEAADLFAELDGLSDEEIRALLAEETALEELA